MYFYRTKRKNIFSKLANNFVVLAIIFSVMIYPLLIPLSFTKAQDSGSNETQETQQDENDGKEDEKNDKKDEEKNKENEKDIEDKEEGNQKEDKDKDKDNAKEFSEDKSDKQKHRHHKKDEIDEVSEKAKSNEEEKVKPDQEKQEEKNIATENKTSDDIATASESQEKLDNDSNNIEEAQENTSLPENDNQKDTSAANTLPDENNNEQQLQQKNNDPQSPATTETEKSTEELEKEKEDCINQKEREAFEENPQFDEQGNPEIEEAKLDEIKEICEEISNKNEAKTTSNSQTTSNTGENEISNIASDLSNPNGASINSGNASASDNTFNQENTNIIGDNYIESVTNINGEQTGNIDLLSLLQNLIANGGSSVITTADQVNKIVNNNDATLDTNASSNANSGNNTIKDALANGIISSGNADSNANIVNLVNRNIVGNNWIFAVVNIFGTWLGDLIVPAPDALKMSASSGQKINVTNNNEADIENNAQVQAATGDNSVTNLLGQGNIATGNANSGVMTTDMANTNITKDNWFFLFINNMGTWTGKVLGWLGDNPSNGVYQYDFDVNNLPDSTDNSSKSDNPLEIINNNKAKVKNNASAVANTGGNVIDNIAGNGTIQTGDANAWAKIANFINTNIVGSNWLFAIVNIMGSWKGNVVFTKPADKNITDGSNTETGNTLNNDNIIVLENQQPSVLKLKRTTSAGKNMRGGDQITNTITLDNKSDNTIKEILIVDRMKDPSGNVIAEYVWPVKSLKKNKKAIVTYTLKLNDNAPIGTYKSNASASGISSNGSPVQINEEKITFAVVGSSLSNNANSLAAIEKIDEQTLQEEEVAQANENSNNYMANQDDDSNKKDIPFRTWVLALLAYMVSVNVTRIPIKKIFGR